jgi:hypothetical protein
VIAVITVAIIATMTMVAITGIAGRHWRVQQ